MGESPQEAVGERGGAHERYQRFWAKLKGALAGTYHDVSGKHLNQYVQQATHPFDVLDGAGVLHD